MADALLGIVIENLGSFVQEEIASFLGVGELTQKLTENLTTIRAVLRDAEKKQITSEPVKIWLQKLGDAAYVLDDILDECSITSKAHGGNKCITHFHPMKILARRNIGKRMKKVAKRIDSIAKERIDFGFQPVGVTEERQQGDNEWRQTTSTITEPKVYGRDKDKEKIVEFLLTHASESEELSVYSIVGHGGYGKTALAQMVFNDESVNTHFDLKIWVCVSDEFSMMKVLESIIENTIRENLHLRSLESMQEKVKEILQNKRYLLVLDDVWTEDREKWNKFKSVLQHRMKGASVLVTTRLDNVASIMGTYPAHPLAGLSDDHIWSLFKQQAFGENGEERAELVEIGKKLVRKCVGSPLAAKVLGSSLNSKTHEHQWNSVLESEFWNLPEDDHIMSALRLSYFNLKSYLRPCFTFCAVFPKGFEMVKENLIHLWMANGLVTSIGNLKMEMEMEHDGDDVWNQLWKISFFQEVKSDLAETGYGLEELHNLQLGGKLYIKGLENVSSVEDAEKANLIGKKDLNRLYLSWDDSAREAKAVLEALEPYSGLTHFGVNEYEGTDFPRWMRNSSILKGLVSIILYNCRNCRQLPPFGKLPCLTTLEVNGMRDLKYIDDDLYEPATEKAFTSLKKLTLYHLPNLVRVLKVKGVEMLTQLSKLHIANVPKLALPSLPSVASLSAHGGNEELLKSVVYESNMYNLKSLRISRFHKLEELPVELGTLSALESLEISFCDEMESFSEHLLKGLSYLRTLSVFACNRFKSLSDGMRHLTCLESLEIEVCPQFVFPDNMNSLTSLRKLVVRECNEHVLDSLGTSFSNIPSLQNLSLDDFPSLTSLPDWLGTMTSLQVLTIIGFPELSSLPENFQQLRNLHTLSIFGSPMLEKRCKRGIGEDWHKIAHIPQFALNGRLQSDAEPTKPTICVNIKSAWKQFCDRPAQDPLVIYSCFEGTIEKEL